MLTAIHVIQDSEMPSLQPICSDGMLPVNTFICLTKTKVPTAKSEDEKQDVPRHKYMLSCSLLESWSLPDTEKKGPRLRLLEFQ